MYQHNYNKSYKVDNNLLIDYKTQSRETSISEEILRLESLFIQCLTNSFKFALETY